MTSKAAPATRAAAALRALALLLLAAAMEASAAGSGLDCPAFASDGARPMFAGLDLDYDPMPVLRSLQAPQLWILGEQDKATPSPRTHGRLMALKRDGHPISVVSYPNIEHGLYEIALQGDDRVDK